MLTKRSSIIAGTSLILAGSAGLFFTVLLPLLGLSIGIGNLWPLSIIAIGGGLVTAPLVLFQKRGFGGMFIPGTPILMSGIMLLVAAVFDQWALWGLLWPLVLVALAIGFLFAAIQMRESGLMMPATIIGMNGLAFLFCTLTGLWSAWAILWVIEPLSVGLGLMIMNQNTRLLGLAAGGIAIVGFVGMTTTLAGLWQINVLVSVALILAGILWLSWNVLRYFGVHRIVMAR